MSYTNPYGQWNGVYGSSSSMVAPLPMTPSVIDKPIVLTMLLNPDPLNATVIVPNGQVYYQITTNQSLAGYTEVKDGQQNRIGLIEWASHPPHVQVRTVLSRRRVGSWLVLSRDGTARGMELAGQTFRWAPDHTHINLFTAGSGRTRLLARVARVQNTVTLEVGEEGHTERTS
ncbi:hypothetical protein DL96DRAFT_681583 [Flagelloscypha sp. PMI_526]|nr:hypothetical protein DL96DRAFT_681583 [Flagelloscypha sp. PMI_526]